MERAPPEIFLAEIDRTLYVGRIDHRGRVGWDM